VLRPVAPRRIAAGFTLVELLIAVTVMVVLLKLAAPSFSTWVQNTRVRTVATSLSNALRQAQGESVRRSRQVVFALTNGTPGVAAGAAASGKNWVLDVVPLPGEALGYVAGGVLADDNNAVAINGPAAICFNSIGRQTANAAPGPVGAICTVSAAAPVTTYDVTQAYADRPLRVTVTLGGQVRMCDPSQSLAGGQLEGC
jgi:type IV fimbrial biogenesis protein FimT